MIPAWARDYVGLTFQERELNCWLFARKIWSERFGFNVPSYDGRYTSTSAEQELGALIRAEMVPEWSEVRLADAEPGDGILLRMRGQPMHVGVVVEPPNFLHIEEDQPSCIERYDGVKWSRRVLGIYRHVSRRAPVEAAR